MNILRIVAIAFVAFTLSACGADSLDSDGGGPNPPPIVDTNETFRGFNNQPTVLYGVNGEDPVVQSTVRALDTNLSIGMDKVYTDTGLGGETYHYIHLQEEMPFRIHPYLLEINWLICADGASTTFDLIANSLFIVDGEVASVRTDFQPTGDTSVCLQYTLEIILNHGVDQQLISIHIDTIANDGTQFRMTDVINMVVSTPPI